MNGRLDTFNSKDRLDTFNGQLYKGSTLETFNGELYKRSTFHHSPPLLFTNHHPTSNKTTPFHQSPPTSNANRPPPFFLLITTVQKLQTESLPLFTNHHLKILGHVEKMKMQENHHLGSFLMDTIICIM